MELSVLNAERQGLARKASKTLELLHLYQKNLWFLRKNYRKNLMLFTLIARRNNINHRNSPTPKSTKHVLKCLKYSMEELVSVQLSQ